ncbi:hypothetical protein C1637_19395 [Chryseobacterium lactis]|uniref:DUF4149 domain-containing protein n=1 Tax=Chryseobacterium lactis TaxID=1241981 RepID=A0A3G6RHB0_CHRLC|nr:hypothetical protein [Chryseobacterium lactis]AZA83183.1 hypothetical protein EG342_15430 [Chryseobacterium lactis]AZB03568.1 hypothetical protein EG341_06300 [Chryseobacterium lactis]PNW11926.1 hypothetical protein C1637_19395 [Chryseobacterium lactis]
MKLYVKNPIVLALFCVMAGMFMTVSFLETPMKFQVQGMTLPVALELGKLMFAISTNIQAILLILIVISMLMSRSVYTKVDFSIISILIFILLLEKFWMLPVLDERVDLLLSGKSLSPTPLHDYFIDAEITKAIMITAAIFFQFKKAI